MLNLTEFVRRCQQNGWTTPPPVAGGGKARSNYTFLTGALHGSAHGKNCWHNGSLYVPIEENTNFLRVCSEAMMYGTQLSLHQSIDAPGKGKPNAVTPLFFDLDWKPFASAGGMTDTVANHIHSLVANSGLLEDAGWCARMAPPEKLRVNFPALADGADKVVAQLAVNVHSKSPINDEFTLAHLFETDTACQNWLAAVTATALGIVCQRVVRRYFALSVPAANSIFTCFVFASHSKSPHASSAQFKLGAHLHFPLPVSPSSAMDISEGLRCELAYITNGSLGDIVDANVHCSGLRMPFTYKPLVPAVASSGGAAAAAAAAAAASAAAAAASAAAGASGGRGRKRAKVVYDSDGNVVLAQQCYVPTEVISSETSLPDDSGFGKTFKTDVLTALMTASVRTTVAAPHPGFDATGLPRSLADTASASEQHDSAESAVNTLARMGVPKARITELQQMARATPQPETFLHDWARYVEYVFGSGTAAVSPSPPPPQQQPPAPGSAAKRPRMPKHVPLPPGSQALAELKQRLPAVIVLLFGPEFSGLEIAAAGLHPAGMARTSVAGGSAGTKECTLCVITTSHVCCNRIDPALAAAAAAQHAPAAIAASGNTKTGHSSSCAWFMCTATSITQCCSNRSVPGGSSGGHFRHSGTACNAWPGHKVVLASYCAAAARQNKQAEAQQIAQAYSRLFSAATAAVMPDTQ